MTYVKSTTAERRRVEVLRVVVGVAVLAVFAITAPAAQAGHNGAGNTGLPKFNHEPRPTASANPTYGEPVGTPPSAVCHVIGIVRTAPAVRAVDDAYEHKPASVPEVNDEPSHSHFTFEGMRLDCGPVPLGRIDVRATGGDDGHQPVPGCTAGNPVADLFGDDPDCNGEHNFNTAATASHHGSINHSAWSNSSGYVAPCAAAGGVNTNKGSITAVNAGTANGWVKYDRLGTVVKAWGTFPCQEGAAVSGKSFWMELAMPVRDFFWTDGEARFYNGTITN